MIATIGSRFRHQSGLPHQFIGAAGAGLSTVISALQEAAARARILLIAPTFEGPIWEVEYRRVLGALVQDRVDADRQ